MKDDVKNLEDRLKSAEKWMIWLTGAIVVVGLLQFGAAFMQWRAIAGQLEEMKSGGVDTHALANAASDQADAAQQFSDTAEDINGRMSEAVDQLSAAAENAKAGIEATQSALRQEQRAWVGMMQITGIPEVGKPFHMTVLFQNTGRTPAMDFVSQERMIPLASGQEFAPNWAAKAPGIHSHALLFPNQSFTAVVKSSGQDVAVDQPALDFVSNGKMTLFVFGRACYKDVFRQKHWIRFCESYDPAGKDWVACAKFNEIDTEQTANEESCTLPDPPIAQN